MVSQGWHLMGLDSHLWVETDVAEGLRGYKTKVRWETLVKVTH